MFFQQMQQTSDNDRQTDRQTDVRLHQDLKMPWAGSRPQALSGNLIRLCCCLPGHSVERLAFLYRSCVLENRFSEGPASVHPLEPLSPNLRFLYSFFLAPHTLSPPGRLRCGACTVPPCRPPSTLGAPGFPEGGGGGCLDIASIYSHSVYFVSKIKPQFINFPLKRAFLISTVFCFPTAIYHKNFYKIEISTADSKHNPRYPVLGMLKP